MTTTMKRITACYTVCSDFYLPPWLKEEDIAEKWIKYDHLFVKTKDGKVYEIPPYCSADDNDLDLKYPDSTEEEEEEVDDEDIEQYCMVEQDDYAEMDEDGTIHMP